MGLIAMLVVACAGAYFLAKAGLLAFASVALGIFWILQMGGCHAHVRKPYCETKAIHRARVHLDEDPEEIPLFNERGLPIEDFRNRSQSSTDGIAHSRGW
jgi:hypothetical protein